MYVEIGRVVRQVIFLISILGVAMKNQRVLRVFAICVLFTLGLVACSKLNNNKKYEVEVNNSIFSIPGGYIWAYDTVRGNKIYNPNLHALYPNFDPKTKSNAKLFEGLGWGGGRLVSFIFVDRAKSKTLDEMVAWRIEGKEVARFDSSTALSIYPSSINGKEYFLGRLKDGDRIVFTCSVEGSVPYPSCNTTLVFNEEVMLGMSFSRDLLSDWRNLCSGLVDKVKEFEK